MGLEAKICRFMYVYDCPSNLSGYYYVKDCIALVTESKSPESNKTMFRSIASKHNTDCTNIERCIRTFVDKAWLPMSRAGIFSKKPSNREFILKCAEHISLDFTPASAYDIIFD